MLSLAVLAGGCSLGGFGGAPNAPAPDASASASSWSISNFFAGASAKAPQAATGGAANANCPPVEVREGASTLAIGPPGDTSTMNLKYQVIFTREARECAVVDGNMVMKIGVQGRVIVGPAGGPGQVDVPLRIAVVQETPSGTRSVVTKFIRIPVTITNIDEGGRFTHIEEGMAFPLPTPVTLLDDYITYVGFDPVTAAAQDKEAMQAKPKPKAKAKPKPKAAPSSAFGSD